METRILESSINKICSLLAVGFGDAGAEVLTCSAVLPAIHACDKPLLGLQLVTSQ